MFPECGYRESISWNNESKVVRFIFARGGLLVGQLFPGRDLPADPMNLHRRFCVRVPVPSDVDAECFRGLPIDTMIYVLAMAKHFLTFGLAKDGLGLVPRELPQKEFVNVA